MKKTLAVQPSRRQKELAWRRQLKMARSAHAYVRGNTQKFYEWLEGSGAAELLPVGPPIWICGDCHTGNLGPVASADGRVEIQIRDLDQTVIGNPAHDLIRLCLSLAMAARSSDLPGITTALMMEEAIDGYLRGLAGKPGKAKKSDVQAVKAIMKQALRRKWRHLAEERIEGVTPEIPLGRRFWKLSKAERAEIERIFLQEDTRKLITCLEARDDNDQVRVLDAAYWVKGCSSLGRLRFAVLAEVGDGGSDSMCLVDIKESVRAAAPRLDDADMPKSNAARIVQGAKALSPFLGERMQAAQFQDKAVCCAS